MKNAYTILSHLSQTPQFKLLKQQECYQKYLGLLGERYQRAIAFIYVRQRTLYIATKHPGFKMELNYSRDLLKELLTRFTSMEQNCTMMEADKVVVFDSKFHTPSPLKTQSDTIPRYAEQATSRFTIESDDTELKEKFETIRKQIQTHQ